MSGSLNKSCTQKNEDSGRERITLSDDFFENLPKDDREEVARVVREVCGSEDDSPGERGRWRIVKIALFTGILLLLLLAMLIF